MISYDMPRKHLAVTRRICGMRLTLIGIAACLMLPLAAHAGQDDAMPVTLTMKFKMGDTTRYKFVQKMTMKMEAPGLPVPELPKTTTSLISEQKVIRLRPEGGAIVTATVKEMHVLANGAEQAAPKVPVTTTEMNAQGKVINMEGLEKSGNPAMDAVSQFFGGSNMSGMSGYLPEKPVKVGDTWEQEIAMPGMLGKGKGTMKCAFVKIETVGKYRTARIHMEMEAPLSAMIAKSGKPTTEASEAMMNMDGTMTSAGDINFAIEEGKVVRTTTQGGGTINMKFNKEALGEAGGKVPESMSMDIKMDMDMFLLPPQSPSAVKTPQKTPQKSRKRSGTR